jgi:hypothetical protein
MTARLLGWAAVTLTRLTHQLGTHVYLSTGCLHGQHGYCQGKTGKSGAKQPARCKFCKAACTCTCHTHHPKED